MSERTDRGKRGKQVRGRKEGKERRKNVLSKKSVVKSKKEENGN